MSIFNGPASAIEDNRNKVISISEDSTDNQYPSAKAVYSELNKKAAMNDIPTKVSQLENDSGFIKAEFAANALKGSASGSAVVLRDVSPVEHEMSVQLSETVDVGEYAVLSDFTITSTQPAAFDGETDISVHLMTNSLWDDEEHGIVSDMILVPLIDGAALEAAGIATQADFETQFRHDYHYMIDGTTLTVSGQYWRTYTGSEITEIDPITVTVPKGAKITGFVLSGTTTMDQPILSVIASRTTYPLVKVLGKNLFDISKIPTRGELLINNGDGTLTIANYAGTNGGKFGDICPTLKVGDIVTLNAISGGKQQIYLSTVKLFWAFGTSQTITEDMLNSSVFFYCASSTDLTPVTMSNIQIELGTTATDYEPYIEPTEYTSNADGTVDGATSLYPTTTIMTDTGGAIIDVTYNRDINKPLTELQKTVDTEISGLKSNLADKLPKSPTDWESWTAEEQAAARSRIGIGIGNAIGESTDGGGEIFNDYINNKALSKYSHTEGSGNTSGGKAFKIIEFRENDKTFVFDTDSVEGLEVGDEYSCRLNFNFDFMGKVKSISYGKISTGDNEIVTVAIVEVDNAPTLAKYGYWAIKVTDESVFWIPSKPELGTSNLDGVSHVEGTRNIAMQIGCHSEGADNITSGKYGHTEGRRTKAGYAAHAQNIDTIARGNFSSAGGQGTIADEIAQDVIGKYNQPNPHALAIVGNGKSDSQRNNAFEVLDDGSATLDKQGLAANSITRKDYIDSRLGKEEHVQVAKNSVVYDCFGGSSLKNLQFTAESADSKAIFSDSPNLININFEKFTVTYNGYPAMTRGGLTLYCKDKKLYLHGTYTGSNFATFYSAATIDFITGIDYRMVILDKIKGIGLSFVNSPTYLDVTMNTESSTGIISKNISGTEIAQNMTTTININVAQGMSFNDREIRFMICDNLYPDNSAPFSQSQIFTGAESVTSYEGDMYIQTSAPCSFDYMRDKDAIRTEDDMRQALSKLGCTVDDDGTVRFIGLN